MLADVQVHRAMLDMTELTLCTLREEGAGAIKEERLTSGVYQLVNVQSFGDADTDQVIYALAPEQLHRPQRPGGDGAQR